ncbi:hypothetical protein VCRA2113O416_250071 [Vibrio crassostreae]|nr:hypothetical protein VCRA2113O416_250071 [Vibrio crassostreae]
MSFAERRLMYTNQLSETLSDSQERKSDIITAPYKSGQNFLHIKLTVSSDKETLVLLAKTLRTIVQKHCINIQNECNRDFLVLKFHTNNPETSLR